MIINDIDAGELVFEDGTALVALNSDMITDGINTIRIHTDEKVLPYSMKNASSSDNRDKNLYVEKMELILSSLRGRDY